MASQECPNQILDISNRSEQVLETRGYFHLLNGIVLCIEGSMIGEPNPKVNRGEGVIHLFLSFQEIATSKGSMLRAPASEFLIR